MKRASLTISPGRVLHEYSESESLSWTVKWLEAFGAKRRGVNAKAFLWHIFSGGRYPSLSGADALASYLEQTAREYVVLSNDRKHAFTTDSAPQACSWSDYYVFPENLAWTMAFTHEDGWLGPYFAYHADFKSLNKANQTKLRKMREAEAASVKGWGSACHLQIT